MCLSYLVVLLVILQMTLTSKLSTESRANFNKSMLLVLFELVLNIFLKTELQNGFLLSCLFPGSYGWCALVVEFFL